MDCLDRTNVTQAALGKWALDRQLRDAGVLSHKETVEDHPEFMNIFRNGMSTSVLTIGTSTSLGHRIERSSTLWWCCLVQN